VLSHHLKTYLKWTFLLKNFFALIGHGRIVSTDRRDFHTYRWKNNEPFTNLLVDVL